MDDENEDDDMLDAAKSSLPWQLVDGPTSSPAAMHLDTTAAASDTNDRLVSVVDAIFALEREPTAAKGSGKRTLLKMYNFS
ncbi:hypothetical protein BC940DRAFT_313874 [Gongronella butleri]|nr:hypothetical protein BC940DRAFT_313874 [Gongronella butleri]